MGFIDNKFVAKFIAGGAAPPLPPTHPQGPLAPAPSQSLIPYGWIEKWDTNSQRTYYLEQATGRTQWELPSYHAPPPETQTQPAPNRDVSSASMLSGTRAHTIMPSNSAAQASSTVASSNIYLNLPTAAERDEMRKKAEANKEKDGDKKYVTA